MADGPSVIHLISFVFLYGPVFLYLIMVMLKYNHSPISLRLAVTTRDYEGLS
jgi:hypothetical protein